MVLSEIELCPFKRNLYGYNRLKIRLITFKQFFKVVQKRSKNHSNKSVFPAKVVHLTPEFCKVDN